jgi:chitinase
MAVKITGIEKSDMLPNRVKTAFSYLIFIFLLGTIFLKRADGQNIIAYYAGNAGQINAYPISRLSHIIFSFCHLKDNKLSVDNSTDSLTIHALVGLKKKNPSLKILLSLGGWGGCRNCSVVFSTVTGRADFVESVMALTDYFHTDGIDLDWEFPSVAAYPDHHYMPEDKVNFNLLIRALRTRLGKAKEISVVCAGFDPYLEKSLDLPALAPYVNRINLMTYDLIGSQAQYSGHQSSLYSTSWQSASADRAVRYLDSLKIPKEKIAIGVAFYARQYQVLENRDHGLNQPAQFKKFVTMRQVRKHYTDVQGYTTYWDPEAAAAYKFNNRNNIFLTYDDERSIAAKCAYVKEMGLNGIFFWQLRLDKPHDGLLDVMGDAMRIHYNHK